MSISNFKRSMAVAICFGLLALASVGEATVHPHPANAIVALP